MADFNLDIVIESQEVQALLGRLVDTGEDLTPVMADIAEGLLHRTEDRFDTQTAPDGTPWQALSPSYAAKKRQQGYTGPLLVREGRLRGELRSDWGRDFAEVATAPLVYAVIHQLGGAEGMAPGPAAVPARPYMGVSDDDEAWLLETIAEHLERIARGG